MEIELNEEEKNVLMFLLKDKLEDIDCEITVVELMSYDEKDATKLRIKKEVFQDILTKLEPIIIKTDDGRTIIWE